MNRVRLSLLAVSFVALLGSGALPAYGAPAEKVPASTYHDAAFTYSYPSGWRSASPDMIGGLKSGFAGAEARLRITDIGGIQNATGPDFGAAVVMIRLRLSKSFRVKVMRARAEFTRLFLNSIAHSASSVLSRGPAVLGGHSARAIEFFQGSAFRFHQKIYVVLSADSRRVFLVYFIALERTWQKFLPVFTSIGHSTAFSP
ncbi:MAG: hypothetical protein NVSMB52_09490 [Chloroflexota bacterium]